MNDGGSREQYEELRDQVARNRADIDALQDGAQVASTRADSADDLAAAQGLRMDTLAARFDLDRAVIAQLQADGLLHEEHAAHLEHALRGSRKIGAAIGIVMAAHGVGEEEAFKLLSSASQDTNRRLSVIAHEVVDKGDASGLPTA